MTKSARLQVAPACERVACFASAAGLPALAHDASPPAPPVSGVTLDPGLGPLRHPVSTRNARARAHSDQGLKLVFAFNHEAAMRSPEKAFNDRR